MGPGASNLSHYLSSSQVELAGGKVWFTDLGSSNGTELNAAELEAHKAAELTSGDVLMLGETRLDVQIQQL